MKPLFESESSVAPVALRDPVLATTPVIRQDPALNALSVAKSARAPIALPDEAKIERTSATATRGLAELPAKLMASVKASDADAFGDDLNKLVGMAKQLDPDQYNRKGLVGKALSLFSNTKERMLAQYNTVEQQMTRLLAELETKAGHHRQRIQDFDRLYESNMQHHQDLDMAAKSLQAECVRLREELANRPAPVDAFEAQQDAEVQRTIDRLEKRVDDWQRGMLLAKQTAPQIRLLQENARGLVQKFADVRDVAIPAWTSAFGLYLLHQEQARDVALCHAVDDATDSALRRGADLLRQNATSIATARQRSVVTVETLQHVQQQLLGAFDDVLRIDREGKAARTAALPQLKALEDELITKLAPGQR